MKTIYYFTVFFLFTLIAFLIFVIVWLLTVAFDRNRTVIHHYSRFWGETIYKLSPWWKVKVEGLENIDKGKAYIILSNHQSMLDIPLLYYIPLDFKWVSKKEVYRIPVFGWVLWMHGDVAIERGGAVSAKRMIAKADSYIKRGLSIIMFPEGTRTKDGRVHKFMPGAFLLAKKSKTAVLPVVIDGNYDAFGSAGKKGIAAPHTFTVRIMPPVEPEEFADMRFDDLSLKMEDMIRKAHMETAPQFYNNTESEK